MSKISYNTLLDGITDSCALTQPIASAARNVVPRRVATPVPQTTGSAEPPPTDVSGSQPPQVLENISINGSEITGTAKLDLTPYQDAVAAISLPASRDVVLQSSVKSTKIKPSVDSLLGIDATGKTTYTSDAQGSALFNSDRIIINAKQQFAMLFGQKGVVIASPTRVNIDAGESITLAAQGGNDGGLFLGLPNRGLRYEAQTQQQIGDSKGDPTPDKPYEPLVLGIKLANWIEDFLTVLKNAIGTDGLSNVKFQPTTQAEFGLLANRIPEILSNYAYIDGVSHGSVDMTQLAAIKESLSTTPDYVPPQKLTGKVTGQVVITGTGGGGGDAGPITDEQKIQNIKVIATYLKSIGITKQGAAGLIGNILGESGANPSAMEHKSKPLVGGTGGIGIVQWTASRRRNLEKAAGNDATKIVDLNFQLQFLGAELQKSYSGVLNKLKSSTSLDESTIYVLEKFEVPGTYLNRGTNPGAYQATQQKRIGYANSALAIVSTVYG